MANKITIDDRRKRKAIPDLSKKQRLATYLKDDKKCVFCGKELKQDEFNIDHFIPKSRGGDNMKDNLLTCCPSTNTFFDSMHPGEKLKLMIKGKYRKFDCASVTVVYPKL